jgi:ElaB/YqjD/DUF883 family membrane-anchored ribosome-binding protein
MTTTNNDPDAIRAEIDRTRGRLSEDVDVLTESVRPSSVAKRTAQRASTKAGRLKETVMGTAHDTVDSGSGLAQGAVDTVKEAPDLARRQARGNPLAAGAVALAAGWLVGSLLPASSKERELATTVKEQAQPLVDEATSVAKETAGNLKEPAQQAVDSVKETAREGAQHVRDDGSSAVQDVKEAAGAGSGSGSSQSGTTGSTSGTSSSGSGSGTSSTGSGSSGSGGTASGTTGTTTPSI